MTRSLAATAAIALLGCGVLWWGTDGLSAFTAESARRLAVTRGPRPLPDVLFEDQDGRLFRLRDLEGRLIAAEFIYTNCPTFCRVLGESFRQVRARLAGVAEHELVLLSISFDPRDDRAKLREYGRRHGADGRTWRIVRAHDPEALKRLLAASGVVAIPDGVGGFEHNAALYLIDNGGRLAHIADFDQPGAFAARVETMRRRRPGA